MKRRQTDVPQYPIAMALCGIAPDRDLRDAQVSVSRLAGKAYHAVVKRELGLKTSYQLEERFSPPNTFRGMDGRPHWWDALERDGVPNLLGSRRKARYDRVAEVAKATEIPGEVLNLRLWRLLDPTPISPFELYSSLHTDAKHFKTESIKSLFAEPFDLDLAVSQIFEPRDIYIQVSVAFFALRRAENIGDLAHYCRALRSWCRLLRILRQDPLFNDWLPGLEQHVETWLCRTKALIRYPDRTRAIEVVLFELDKEREEVSPKILTFHGMATSIPNGRQTRKALPKREHLARRSDTQL